MSGPDTRAPAGLPLLQGYLDRLLREVPQAGAAPAPPAQVQAAAQDQASLRPQRDGGSGSAGDHSEGPASAPRVDANWREHDFQALLFRIGNLQLAVPLVRLCGVIPWSDKIATMPAAPDWYLGLLHHQAHNVRVVDTAKLVFERQDVDAGTASRHIVLFDEGRWGMTCSAICEVLSLAPDSVKWRGRGGRRAWLAGTVRDRLCAVIDVDAFAAMLASQQPGEARAVGLNPA